MRKFDLELSVGVFLLAGILCLGYLSVKLARMEVFGGKGETVITDLVFPDGSPDGVTVTCEQGAAVIETLDLWHLDASHEPATP